jgi:hypothetical protein
LVDRPGWFIAGDAQTGPSSIVRAMADGIRAAGKVNTFLGTEQPALTPRLKMDEQSLPTPSFNASGGVAHPSVLPPGFIGRDPRFHDRRRIDAEIVPLGERTRSFAPYQFTLARSQALEEAARCLRCHLRASLRKAPLPPDPWKPFTDGIQIDIPESAGVMVLSDENRRTVKIQGADNLRQTFTKLLSDGARAAFCRWELDPMFTKRESELIQAHLQAFGKMPGGDELDDLF